MQWFSGSKSKAKEPQRRIEAINRLGTARDSKAVTAVLAALADPDLNVRLAALRVTAQWQDDYALQGLSQALRDPVSEVREQAITALRMMGTKESTAALIPSLADPVASVRTQAVQMLTALGWSPETPNDRILHFIGHGQFGKAAAVGRESVELLLPFAEHPIVSTRRDVAEAFGVVRDPRVNVALEKMLSDIDSSVRIAAIDSLMRIQAPISLIGRMTKDPDKNVRAAAAETLGEMRDTEAVPIVSECLKDEHWSVRCAAASALGLIGERTSVPLLVNCLKDQDIDMRVASAEALGLIGDVEAVEPLILAQLDPETRVRQAAVSAVVRVDYRWHRNPRAYRTLPLLKRAARSDNLSIRTGATELLDRIFSIRRVSWKSSGVDPEADRRMQAAEMLITCLWDDDALIQGAAAETLGHLRSRRAQDALKVRAEDTHVWVSAQARAALESLERTDSKPDMGWCPSPSS